MNDEKNRVRTKNGVIISESDIKFVDITEETDAYSTPEQIIWCISRKTHLSSLDFKEKVTILKYLQGEYSPNYAIDETKCDCKGM